MTIIIGMLVACNEITTFLKVADFLMSLIKKLKWMILKKYCQSLFGIMFILSFSLVAFQAEDTTKGKQAVTESEDPGEIKLAAESGRYGEEKPTEKSGH